MCPAYRAVRYGARGPMNPLVRVFSPAQEFESAAAHEIARAAGAAIRDRGLAVLALSGGETPRTVYRRLAVLPTDAQPDWTAVHLLFGDERLVPYDDPQSNYGMVRQELLSRIAIPEANIHSVPTAMAPPDAARAYAADLRTLLARAGGRCDLVLLGLGEDGHTASLFPGADALSISKEEASAVYAPALKSWRVTVTLPVINTARRVLFLVAGMRKALVVRQVLRAREPVPSLPATLIRPTEGELIWFLDSDAASSLEPAEQMSPGRPAS